MFELTVDPSQNGEFDAGDILWPTICPRIYTGSVVPRAGRKSSVSAGSALGSSGAMRKAPCKWQKRKQARRTVVKVKRACKAVQFGKGVAVSVVWIVLVVLAGAGSRRTDKAEIVTQTMCR